MKRLRFCYEMRLTFDQEVWEHHFLIRCLPMENGQQHRERMSVKIEPADFVNEVTDGFGNGGYAGSVRKPHDSLSVMAEGIVCVEQSGSTDRFHPMYCFPSAYTMPDEGIRRFFGEICKELGKSCEACKDSWEKSGKVQGAHETARKGCEISREELVYMMNRLYGRFVYAPGTTTVKTTAAQALAAGQGVCQDYAHVFISLCRLAGVPARYAAGVMLGEGASHAWVELWQDGRWLGLDPTNNRLVDETYIKLTHGRDFGDGTIDRGRFLGFAGQSQKVRVSVEEIL